MRILLLGLTGAEPAFIAWAEWLARAGVPHDAIACKDLTEPLRFTRGSESGGEAPSVHQGLILSDPGLLGIAVEPEERAALRRLERELGLRRLVAYAYPGPETGLRTARWSGPLDEVAPELTDAGREVFPYLRSRLAVDPGSWAYVADPVDQRSFQTLLTGSEGGALLGVRRQPDGREEMVQTFDANPAQVQGLLLRRGQLAWLMRGAYLGYERHYLPIQVDDVLLGNHSWSVGSHRSDREPTSRVRMSAADARRAGEWARSRGLRLDLACNGGGSETEVNATGNDPLLDALLAQDGAFGWINHTYGHADVDRLDRSEIEDEIARNVAWAQPAGVNLEPSTLVTGAHTGLANLAAAPPHEENRDLPAALRAQRIRFLACDASRPYPSRAGGKNLAPGMPFFVGSAFAVPRHPTVLAHDVVTPSQVLDRLRSDADPGASPILSFAQVIDAEARRLRSTTIANDPRPHYFHQSNLIGEEDQPGIIYALLDAVVERYRESVADDIPLLQPTLGETGRLLLRLEAWRAVEALHSVEAFREGDVIVVENGAPTAIELPITGTTVGEAYAGTRSGWMRADPGTTRIDLA